jgi:hypothetical protein
MHPTSLAALAAARPMPQRMRGQALILAVVFLAVLCVGVLMLFNTGQSLNRKSQLVNAADAAAYSVAVQQARVLNFSAYTHRARVANEVAVAQLIGLYSWMNQINTTAITFQRTMGVLKAIPYVGQAVFLPLEQAFRAIDQVMRVVRQVYRPLAQAAIIAIDTLNGTLASSTRILFNTVTRAGDAIVLAREIVSTNAPGARLSTAGSGVLTAQLNSAFNNFIERHDIPARGTRDGAERFRNVVMKSRDEFSWSRDKDWNLLIIKFNQAGGTDMVDYNRWVAVDGLTLEVNLPWPLSDIDIPLGWGGAQAVQNYQNQRFMNGINNGSGWRDAWNGNRLHRPYGDARRDLGRAAVNNVENDPNVRRANGQKQGSYFTGYNGLRDYDDVVAGRASDPNTSDTEKTGPVFTVHVQSAEALSRTSEHVDGIGGAAGSRIHLDDQTKGGDVSAFASAQLYFNRPFALSTFARSDRKLEQGNLFNPYWQARLVETPDAVKLSLGLLL